MMWYFKQTSSVGVAKFGVYTPDNVVALECYSIQDAMRMVNYLNGGTGQPVPIVVAADANVRPV